MIDFALIIIWLDSFNEGLIKISLNNFFFEFRIIHIYHTPHVTRINHEMLDKCCNNHNNIISRISHKPSEHYTAIY